MPKKYIKKERLEYHTRRQGLDASSQPRNPVTAIHSAMSMLDYERQARLRGVPVSRVIAEAICQQS